MSELSPRKAEEMVLYAWVGAQDNNSGVTNFSFDIKQAVSPAGLIPMVASEKEKMTDVYIVEQMRQ